MNPFLHSLYDGGSLSVVLLMLGMFYRVYRKWTSRMDRDEDIKRDFPPHKHITGGIIDYPADYQPKPYGKLNGGA